MSGKGGSGRAMMRRSLRDWEARIPVDGEAVRVPSIFRGSHTWLKLLRTGQIAEERRTAPRGHAEWWIRRTRPGEPLTVD